MFGWVEQVDEELTEPQDELDCEFELLGLVGLRDPLRASAADSIRRAREADLSLCPDGDGWRTTTFVGTTNVGSGTASQDRCPRP